MTERPHGEAHEPLDGSAGGPAGGAGDHPDRTLDAARLEVAFEARNEFEAQCVRALLEEVGIRSVTVPSGELVYGFPLCTGGRVPVRVLPEDLTRARQAISEAKFVGRSIDWDELDVGEVPPEVARVLAGSRRARLVRRAFYAVAALLLAAIAVSFVVGLVTSIARTR